MAHRWCPASIPRASARLVKERPMRNQLSPDTVVETSLPEHDLLTVQFMVLQLSKAEDQMKSHMLAQSAAYADFPEGIFAYNHLALAADAGRSLLRTMRDDRAVCEFRQ